MSIPFILLKKIKNKIKKTTLESRTHILIKGFRERSNEPSVQPKTVNQLLWKVYQSTLITQ